VQLFTMGAIFSVMAFCGDGTWGMIAGTARTWFANSPNRIKRMRLVGASVMLMLGFVVIASALLSVA
jgi:threonine/homoserine/homoserine lactone efflux protein